MSQNNENEQLTQDEQMQQTSAESEEVAESDPETTENEAPVKQPKGEVKQQDDFTAKLCKFGKAAWAYIKHARIELIVLVAVLVADLVSKAIINACMDVGQSVQLIPDFLYITYVHNNMAAFGSAFGLEKVLSPEAIRIIFLIITLIAMGVFAYIMYRCRRRHILMRVSLAMILAGALGNFVDRLFLAYVRDFVEIVFFGCDLPLFGTSFAIFNIADVGLTVGVIVFLIYFIVYFKEPKQSETKTVKSTVKPNTQSNTTQPAEKPQASDSRSAENDARSDGENSDSDVGDNK